MHKVFLSFIYCSDIKGGINVKKNQFALIFLTLIVMLAVWYVKAPLSKSQQTTPTDNDSDVSLRLDALSSRRDEVLSMRSLETTTYDEVIASADTTPLQKEEALNKKQSLSDLTEKEILLETFIMNLGYNDAFVYASSDGIEVIVVSEEENIDVALEIIQNCCESFDTTENIVVSFKTETQLTQN